MTEDGQQTTEQTADQKSLVKQFLGKEAGPLVQFIKYGISGGIATVTHIIIFFLLAAFVFKALGEDDIAVKYLKLPPVLDDAVRGRNTAINNVIGFMFSNFVAYILNIFWVFEAGKHKKSAEIAMFYAVSGASLGIGTALAWALIEFTGMATTYAFGVNVVVSVMINFVARKFFIFKG